jgi:ribokinase
MTRAPSNLIVVVGSSNTDMILRMARIPGPGETLLGGEFAVAPGGKGANQAVAASRAGGNVAFVASLGSDSLGDEALARFKAEGMDVSGIVRDREKPSGVALIFVSKAGENSIGVAGGANQRLLPRHIRAARGLIAKARVLVLQLETPLETVAEAARIGRKAGAWVILNPAPAQRLPDSLLRNVSLLTPNEHEASILTGIKVTGPSTAAKAARVLLAKGVGSVIVTLGSQGAFLAEPALTTLVPGFKVKAIDTTAAGDVFNGALAVGLARGSRILDAIRFAHAAAAISVTRPGAQPSIPTKREIETLLRK